MKDQKVRDNQGGQENQGGESKPRFYAKSKTANPLPRRIVYDDVDDDEKYTRQASKPISENNEASIGDKKHSENTKSDNKYPYGKEGFQLQ